MRKLISLLLTVSGVFMLITSFVMYILPTGRVAYWADYHLLWLNKTQWGDLHTTLGTLVIFCSIFHFLLNIRPLCAYLRNKARRVSLLNANFITALIITLYVAGGTIFSLPPMNYILEYGAQFKQEAELEYGVPPYGHAELSSLKKFCQKMDLDSQAAVELLLNAGIIAAENESIKDIAARSKKTPQQIFNMIKSAGENVEQKSVGSVKSDSLNEEASHGVSKPAGLGKMTLVAVCEHYGVSLESALVHLGEQGIVAEPTQTLKEIATANETIPMVILEIIEN